MKLSKYLSPGVFIRGLFSRDSVLGVVVAIESRTNILMVSYNGQPPVPQSMTSDAEVLIIVNDGGRPAGIWVPAVVHDEHEN
jgi:hypothetical protein